MNRADDVWLNLLAEVEQQVETPIEDLPPLYDSVDTDAVTALFGFNRSSDDRDVEGSISFQYAGANVMLFADGGVLVESLDA